MRLTDIACMNDIFYYIKDSALITDGEILDKLGPLEDIEENLGFGLDELIQMLIGGIWEAGAVDSKTMVPVSQGITHFYIYKIDFDNQKIKVFQKVYDETLFTELDLDKYKRKCLGGWALTRKELLDI